MGEGEALYEEPRQLNLVFKGSTSAYFRIWIVNLCLTFFTLGIFSAWAKVRRKRYFYSHTELDGVPFQYLASPIPILKGRLIGAALLALWYTGTHFSTTLLLCVLGLGAVLAPWVMVRSAAFNARYSSYRNFSFEFRGTYWGAAAALLLAGLQVVLTCGLGYPWALARVRRFFLSHTYFGGVPVRYTAKGGHLVMPVLIVGASAVLGGILLAALVDLTHPTASTMTSSFTPIALVSYAAYGIGFAHLQASLANINWRHTSLGPLAFETAYRTTDFVWLYFSNAVAILGSLGVLVPWASIRMYRYRVGQFGVRQLAPLDDFTGHSGAAVRAAGAEVADLFDFDLSL